MKILFIGDVFGESGRDAITKYLPEIRKKHNPDSVIVNGENSAHGLGITQKIAEDFFDLGVNCITGGDHSFDKKEVIPFMNDDPRLIRPINFPQHDDVPGNGIYSYRDHKGKFVTVINAMGRVFMNALIDCPFKALDKTLANIKLKTNSDAIIVDFHCEATSEIVCMGHHIDGRVSAVLGTHTHIPTADHRILENGTAYQSDVGMTGNYNSSIGMDFKAPMQAYLIGRRLDKMEPLKGPAMLCGALIEINETTGLADKMEPIRYGDHGLSQSF
jgi:metallophosphoesterase (TIGR00282 family)